MRFQLYDSAFEKCDYPEQMKIIWTYLQANGALFCTVEDIEEAYYDFSEERGASWLSVNSETLADFAEWLDKK